MRFCNVAGRVRDRRRASKFSRPPSAGEVFCRHSDPLNRRHPLPPPPTGGVLFRGEGGGGHVFSPPQKLLYYTSLPKILPYGSNIAGGHCEHVTIHMYAFDHQAPLTRSLEAVRPACSTPRRTNSGAPADHSGSAIFENFKIFDSGSVDSAPGGDPSGLRHSFVLGSSRRVGRLSGTV